MTENREENKVKRWKDEGSGALIYIILTSSKIKGIIAFTGSLTQSEGKGTLQEHGEAEKLTTFVPK